MQDVDWTLLRVFAAVAEHGSLSAAARALGSSQPTVGRQVHALEQALGLELFLRQPRGLDLSAAGQELLPYARQMSEAAARMRMAAAGADHSPSGTVRITAAEAICHYVLPKALVRLRQEVPALQIELVPSDKTENLMFRNADIALRMYRPTQLDLIARHLGDIPMGAFASKDYLDRRGRPQTAEALLGHDMVGQDRTTLLIDGMQAGGFQVSRDSFGLRVDKQPVYWELVRAGGGIGFGQVAIARQDPMLEQVLNDVPMPSLPVWLIAPSAIRHTPRVARVWTVLAEAMQAHIAAGQGGAAP